MLKLRIGNKSAFFFCGDVHLSRKTKKEVEVDVNDLDPKVAKGVLQGIKSQSLFCDEGLEELEAKVQTLKQEVVEPVVEVSVPEVEVLPEVTPVPEETVKEDPVVLEEVKKPSTRQPKAKSTPVK